MQPEPQTLHGLFDLLRFGVDTDDDAMGKSRGVDGLDDSLHRPKTDAGNDDIARFHRQHEFGRIYGVKEDRSQIDPIAQLGLEFGDHARCSIDEVKLGESVSGPGREADQAVVATEIPGGAVLDDEGTQTRDSRGDFWFEVVGEP